MSHILSQPAQLRTMMLDDLATVATIEQRVSPAPWVADIFEKCLLLNYSAWVAEIDGSIVGFGIVSIAASEAHILNIAVYPTMQRHGIGRQLLTHLLNIAVEESTETIFLEVRASNIAAQQLYQQFGFEKISVRKAYYRRGKGREDAWVYRLLLSKEELSRENYPK